MATGTFGEYSAVHKPWDHVGNITPDLHHSEGIQPSINMIPAPWLPVQFWDKQYENWFVCMTGKLVACDNLGYAVPAGYGVAAATITYTANDVSAGVIDVRTGVALLTAAIGTFNVAAVTTYMGGTSALAVSKFIGVAPYNFHQYAGDNVNPVNYRFHNYIMQSGVGPECDYVLRIPLVPASHAAEPLTFTLSGTTCTSSALGHLPVAKNTVRTPMAFTGGLTATNSFANQVDTIADISAQGDWCINLTTGVISAYATSNITGCSIAYYHYASAPATVSAFTCAVGNLKPGDFVIPDVNSNYALAVGTETFVDIVGQVLGYVEYPHSALERVRTAFSPAIGTDSTGALPGSLGQMDQMPGSATGGVSDAINFTGGANLEVIINLISR